MDTQTKKAVQIFSYYLIITIIVFFIEISQVIPAEIYYFIFAKSFGFFSAFVAIWRLRKSGEYDLLAYVMICISFTTYPFLGELFRPTYEYSMLPIYLAFGMFVPLKKIVIYLFQIIGTIAFCLVYYFTYERNLKLISQMNVYDNIFSLVIFGLTAGYVTHVLGFERSLRLQAQMRFFLIGRHATTIVHDLKNMIGLPRLQIDNLKKMLTEPELKLPIDAKNILSLQIDEIENSIEQTAQTAIRFNQMVVLSNEQKVEVSLLELIQEVTLILKRQLNGIDVDIVGNRQMKVDRGLTLSLFLNLFLNSIDALVGVDLKKIEVIIDPKRVTFKDNGAGFSAEAIENFENMKMISAKKYGSGFGLLIIKEASEELGAKPKFYNLAHGGACIELIW
jgi:hypothetical protein